MRKLKKTEFFRICHDIKGIMQKDWESANRNWSEINNLTSAIGDMWEQLKDTPYIFENDEETY